MTIMPNPLRQKVYMEHLFQEELQGKLGKPVGQVNDDLLRKQKDLVARRVKELNIERATRSPASKEIDKTVIKVRARCSMSNDEHTYLCIQ
jgi:hypothetical protein